MKVNFFPLALLLSLFIAIENVEDIDSNGYILFCLCMGRFGNQAEHFLGGLAFAKLINRTLIVPPWRTYKNIPYSQWFQIESLRAYHRVIEAEEFMTNVAPQVWPQESRIGFCWLSSDRPKSDCQMKEGNPFEAFWNELNVSFVDTETYQLNYDQYSIPQWQQVFPPSRYPVLALKGAPASFPMLAEHRQLQKYMNWSEEIMEEVRIHQKKLFNNEPYIGIHLRNDIDWERSCADVESFHTRSYMASPQCLDLPSSTHQYVTHQICYPSDEEILRLLKNIVLRTRIHHIYIATDKRPMIQEIEEHLAAQRVHVKHLDPWLPVIDAAMLAHANYFIGNCVSSFTSVVKRARDVQGLPSAFWGFMLSLLTSTNETVYGVWNTTAGSNSLPSPSGEQPGCYFSGEEPQKAFDRSNSTKYTNFGVCNSSLFSDQCGLNSGLYLTLQRGPSLLRAVRFCTASSLINRDPLIITIEGSNQPPNALSSGLSWSLIYNGSTGLQNVTTQETFGTTENLSNNYQWYTSYRILVTLKRGIDTAVQYSEIELLG